MRADPHEANAVDVPLGVEVEDLSYGPVAIMHSLDERQPFDRMILIAGMARGSTPGEIRRYRWAGELPDREEVQARVVEAATGVISLENFLVVATWFGKLPPDVVVVEIEPEREECGDALSACIEATIPAVIAEIERVIERERARLDRRPVDAG